MEMEVLGQLANDKDLKRIFNYQGISQFLRKTLTKQKYFSIII